MFVSECCLAETTIVMSADFIGDNPNTMKIGTCHFMCLKCGEPCDIITLDDPIGRRNVKHQR